MYEVRWTMDDLESERAYARVWWSGLYVMPDAQ